MPKIIVTNSLAETLKMLRLQNGVKSKDLAAHIKKSPSYISKLESQEISNIEIETVESIFSFILGADYQKTEIWEQIYASLQLKYSKEEIEEEIWFTNFDTVYRNIPVPESIIDLFNEKISQLSITRQLLLDRINANEALSEEDKNNSKIKVNHWYQTKPSEGPFIKILITKQMLFEILDKQKSSCPYVFIFCILYYLLKIEKYGDVIKLDDSEIRQLNQNTTDILNSIRLLKDAIW